MAAGGDYYDYLPLFSMVVVQMGYSGMNIVSKLALDSGMNPLVHVAYRQIFAAVAIAPFAFFFERKRRPKMTLPILFRIFLSSIFGVTMNQMTYFIGLKNSTPTIACALTNLLPAVTFLLALPLRLESVGIGRRAGKAKVIGTLLCVGGAMVLSFYRGPAVALGESRIHWKYAEKYMGSSSRTNANNPSNSNHGNLILGPFLLTISSVSWAFWFIIQARMCDSYPAPYSSSALACLMASVQCGIIGLCAKHDLSSWSLNKGIRAISSLYAGIVCSAVGYSIMSWCIERKGPLYVSVFSPLQLVIVTALSWALLREQLYLGTVAGSGLIVMGLYGVLWGKSKEADGEEEEEEEEDESSEIKERKNRPDDVDLEFALPTPTLRQK